MGSRIKASTIPGWSGLARSVGREIPPLNSKGNVLIQVGDCRAGKPPDSLRVCVDSIRDCQAGGPPDPFEAMRVMRSGTCSPNGIERLIRLGKRSLKVAVRGGLRDLIRKSYING